jgi:hypothetical protein
MVKQPRSHQPNILSLICLGEWYAAALRFEIVGGIAIEILNVHAEGELQNVEWIVGVEDGGEGFVVVGLEFEEVGQTVEKVVRRREEFLVEN